MKIGIYVGSFNPIHLGHVNVINYLLDNKYLDKLFIKIGKSFDNSETIISWII